MNRCLCGKMSTFAFRFGSDRSRNENTDLMHLDLMDRSIVPRHSSKLSEFRRHPNPMQVRRSASFGAGVGEVRRGRGQISMLPCVVLDGGVCEFQHGRSRRFHECVDRRSRGTGDGDCVEIHTRPRRESHTTALKLTHDSVETRPLKSSRPRSINHRPARGHPDLIAQVLGAWLLDYPQRRLDYRAASRKSALQRSQFEGSSRDML